ncbi:hypothetical protein I79_019627 [Cricetulus griseus]|uniref:Secreted protein n=1 Tax=Cricetulus griseus TaxID=10029 RepID=G3I7X6_CRIGR|nr:hypothetical protein I79_019627 [Cricetulus griseus]
MFEFMLSIFLFLFVCLFVLRQGYSVALVLSCNSLCRPGWPQTHRDLPVSAGIKGICHCSHILTTQNHSPRKSNQSVYLCFKMNLWALERDIRREIQHHEMSPPQGMNG